MLRNLAEVHPKHFAAFLNSFHTIFCDFDGEFLKSYAR